MQKKKTKKVVVVTIPGNQGAQVANGKEEEESGVVEDDDLQLFDAVFDDPDPFPENESNNIGSTAVAGAYDLTSLDKVEQPPSKVPDVSTVAAKQPGVKKPPNHIVQPPKNISYGPVVSHPKPDATWMPRQTTADRPENDRRVPTESGNEGDRYVSTLRFEMR